MRATTIFASLLIFAAGAQDAGVQEASPPVLLLNAWDCSTIQDLHSWRDHRSSEIARFVPKDFQQASLGAMRSEFEQRAAELAEFDTSAPSDSSSVIIAEEPPKKALPVFLPGEGTYSTEEDLSAWRTRQEGRINDLVPDDYLEIAQGSLSREYNERTGHAAGGRLPALLFLSSAKNVTSISDLQVWRSVQAVRVASVVPDSYQSVALSSIDQEYAKHLDRLRLGQATPPQLSSEESPPVPPPTVVEALSEQESAGGVAWIALGAAVCAAAVGAVVVTARRRRGGEEDEEVAGYIMVA